VDCDNKSASIRSCGRPEERIAANNHIFNVVAVEKFQQIAEVGVDEHQVLSLAMRERLVPRWRQSGIGVFDFARIANQRIDPDPQFFLGASLQSASWHVFPSL